MTPCYRLEQVAHSYGERQVLTIPQLQIHSGEILALVGPSGAGKSTLLRLLNFLEMPARGRLYFGEHLVTQALSLERRRQVVGVFQRPGLLHRSVVANIGYGVRLRGRVPDPTQLQHWLDQLGLAPLSQQAAPKLSAGEGQRVALARALIIQPDVLLLDEPTANLDPYNVGLIEQVVQADQATRGMTVVWVTHDLFQARRVAHRVALMVAGRVVEIGGKDGFFNQPQSEVAAAFLRGELVYR